MHSHQVSTEHQMSKVNILMGGREKLLQLSEIKRFYLCTSSPLSPLLSLPHPTEHICDEADNISSQINNKLWTSNITNSKYQKNQIPLEYLTHRLQMENGWRCCYFLRMQNKVVTMTFSSNYSGQDPKEGTRSIWYILLSRPENNLNHPSELILDEHVECGCQCTPGDHCIFNFVEKYFFSLRSTLQLRRNIWWKNLRMRM